MSALEHIEERYLRRGNKYLRLIINHSQGHMRFMDFRVGNYPEKREALDELAKTMHLRKVFTLVEKQDSNNWRSVGFSREGVYPSFFRMADAYAMSRLYDVSGQPVPASATLKAQTDEQTSFTTRKFEKPEGLRIELLQDEQSRSSVFSGLNGQLQALPFGRTAAPDIVLRATARKKEGWVVAEIDESYGHATLGFAPPPSEEADLALSAFAGHSLFSTLREKHVNNVFGLSRAHATWSNELFAGLGFKVTGRLADHLRTPDGYALTLIWHRRLTN